MKPESFSPIPPFTLSLIHISILIDEARTPLIISGEGGKSTDMYKTADRFVRDLHVDTDFTIEEKEKQVSQMCVRDRVRLFQSVDELIQALADVKKDSIICAGGRGFKKTEELSLVEKLAKATGGTMAASRGAVARCV